MPKGKSKKEYKFKNPELKAEDGKNITPKAKGSIPKLAVLLGLLSPLYYEIYENCDGKTSIEMLSEKLRIDLPKMLIHIDQLQRNGLVNLK